MVIVFFIDNRVSRESGGSQLPRQAGAKVLPQLAGKRDFEYFLKLFLCEIISTVYVLGRLQQVPGLHD